VYAAEMQSVPRRVVRRIGLRLAEQNSGGADQYTGGKPERDWRDETDVGKRTPAVGSRLQRER
jgi:hypothetical protein